MASTSTKRTTSTSTPRGLFQKQWQSASCIETDDKSKISTKSKKKIVGSPPPKKRSLSVGRRPQKQSSFADRDKIKPSSNSSLSTDSSSKSRSTIKNTPLEASSHSKKSLDPPVGESSKTRTRRTVTVASSEYSKSEREHSRKTLSIPAGEDTADRFESKIKPSSDSSLPTESSSKSRSAIKNTPVESSSHSKKSLDPPVGESSKTKTRRTVTAASPEYSKSEVGHSRKTLSIPAEDTVDRFESKLKPSSNSSLPTESSSKSRTANTPLEASSHSKMSRASSVGESSKTRTRRTVTVASSEYSKSEQEHSRKTLSNRPEDTADQCESNVKPSSNSSLPTESSRKSRSAIKNTPVESSSHSKKSLDPPVGESSKTKTRRPVTAASSEYSKSKGGHSHKTLSIPAEDTVDRFKSNVKPSSNSSLPTESPRKSRSAIKNTSVESSSHSKKSLDPPVGESSNTRTRRTVPLASSEYSKSKQEHSRKTLSIPAEDTADWCEKSKIKPASNSSLSVDSSIESRGAINTPLESSAHSPKSLASPVSESSKTKTRRTVIVASSEYSKSEQEHSPKMLSIPPEDTPKRRSRTVDKMSDNTTTRRPLTLPSENVPKHRSRSANRTPDAPSELPVVARSRSADRMPDAPSELPIVARDRPLKRSQSLNTRKRAVQNQGSFGNDNGNENDNGDVLFSVSVITTTPCGESSEWHDAIQEKAWDRLEKLLKKYDHTKYRKQTSGVKSPPSKPKKPQRKLRIMKLFKRINGNTSEKVEEKEVVSPLLKVDVKGRTPLHLACKQPTPVKLLQRLLFVERTAASIQDEDGRLPLHVAILYYKSEQIVDKLIRAHPVGLTSIDYMKRTPLAYCVQQAISQRDKSVDVSWSTPISKRETEWQQKQIKVWNRVKFLLETLALRRQSLSQHTEQHMLLEALDSLAPPSIVLQLTMMSKHLLREVEGLDKRVLQKLFQLYYPAVLMKRLFAVSSDEIGKASLLNIMRQGMAGHYRDGCIKLLRGDGRDTSLKSELLQVHRQKQYGADTKCSRSCEEWWSKLRSFIAFSSLNFDISDKVDNQYFLHMALCVPNSPPALIEFLIKLLPHARYERDPFSGNLPIHLACRYWEYKSSRWKTEDEPSEIKILNLLLVGDSEMVWEAFKDRLPLHHAVLNEKSLPFLQALLALDPKTAAISDPTTKLYPFQLAAWCSIDPEDNSGLDAIYTLLRAQPSAITSPQRNNNSLGGFPIRPVTEHFLKWCYHLHQSEVHDGEWVLNKRKAQILRDAITSSQIPAELESWWLDLKVLIWYGQAGSPIPPGEEWLLHAALANNGDMPPLIIELILELVPQSVSIPLPGTTLYPLHLAAAAAKYIPMPFEKVLSMTSSLEMIFYIYPEAMKYDWGDRHVLHIAISRGKIWDELRPLVEHDLDSLSIPDLRTSLFPFQLMAARQSSLPVQVLVNTQTRTMDWDGASNRDKGGLIRKIQKEHELDKLSSVFELLTRKPEVLSAGFMEDTTMCHSSIQVLNSSFSHILVDCL